MKRIDQIRKMSSEGLARFLADMARHYRSCCDKCYDCVDCPLDEAALCDKEDIKEWLEEEVDLTELNCDIGTVKEKLIDEIEKLDWYHVNPKGKLVHGSTSERESYWKCDDVMAVIERML